MRPTSPKHNANCTANVALNVNPTNAEHHVDEDVNNVGDDDCSGNQIYLDHQQGDNLDSEWGEIFDDSGAVHFGYSTPLPSMQFQLGAQLSSTSRAPPMPSRSPYMKCF